MSWAVPLRLDATGAFPSRRPDPCPDTFRLVLGVAPGERRLLPEFGWRAHLLPDLDDPLRKEAAAVFAEEALRRWAGDLGVERVEVLSVQGRKVALEVRARGESYRLEVDLVRWDAS